MRKQACENKYSKKKKDKCVNMLIKGKKIRKTEKKMEYGVWSSGK